MKPRSENSHSRVPILLAAFVAAVVFGSGYLATVLTVAQSPRPQVDYSTLPKETLTANSFEIQMLNASVALTPGKASVIVFTITAPATGEFTVGLIPYSQDNGMILHPSIPMSLPDGLHASFPGGTSLAGSTLRVPVALLAANSSQSQQVSLKFVAFQSVSGTYLGESFDFVAVVS